MEVGLLEMVLIGLMAFVVLGPKELVIRSRQLARWIARIKAELHNFKTMAEEQILQGSDLDFKQKIDLGLDLNEKLKSPMDAVKTTAKLDISEKPSHG